MFDFNCLTENKGNLPNPYVIVKDKNGVRYYYHGKDRRTGEPRFYKTIINSTVDCYLRLYSNQWRATNEMLSVIDAEKFWRVDCGATYSIVNLNG